MFVPAKIPKGYFVQFPDHFPECAVKQRKIPAAVQRGGQASDAFSIQQANMVILSVAR